jgi:hypothetical protein
MAATHLPLPHHGALVIHCGGENVDVVDFAVLLSMRRMCDFKQRIDSKPDYQSFQRLFFVSFSGEELDDCDAGS